MIKTVEIRYSVLQISLPTESHVSHDSTRNLNWNDCLSTLPTVLYVSESKWKIKLEALIWDESLSAQWQSEQELEWLLMKCFEV